MKPGFTFVETLIAMFVLFIIFDIFGLSLITALKVAHIETTISTAQSELRLLDMKMYSLIGSKGCEIRDFIDDNNVDCSDNDKSIKIASYIIKVDDHIEKIISCNASKTIRVVIKYKLMGEETTKTLHYPLPIGTLCK